MCCSSVPASVTTSRTVFWLSPNAQRVVNGDGCRQLVAPAAPAEMLVRQHLVHRRSPQVAVGEVVVAVERQDHVRAVEDVTLRACSCAAGNRPAGRNS